MALASPDLPEMLFSWASSQVSNSSKTALAQGNPLFGRLCTRSLLYFLEKRDAFDGFLGDLQTLGLEDIHEFAPRMCHAGHLVKLIFGE